MAEANWYVVHTYSGYENKVKANIDKTIENRHLEDQILEVRVPMEDVVEVKNGVKKLVLHLLDGVLSITSLLDFSNANIIAGIESVTKFSHNNCNVVNISIFINIETNTKITSMIFPANK